jgi:hypothetical protein
MDKVCPTFSHFSVHEWKLTKISRYLTVFPGHFNNIFLKSFGLLPNLTRNFKSLQKSNDISCNFSGIIILCFHSVAMYFVDIRFCSQYFQKMPAKFQFHSNRFKNLKFWTWQWRKLKNSISLLPISNLV